jgi:hypothetical protein
MADEEGVIHMRVYGPDCTYRVWIANRTKLRRGGLGWTKSVS